MRLPLAVMLLAATVAAQAQSQPRPVPPGSRPLDEPPPMPAATTAQDLITPATTTRMEGEDEITEYRVKGKLYMMKVKPKNGPGYTLMDNKGDGTFSRQDHTLTPNTAVPQWVLLEF